MYASHTTSNVPAGNGPFPSAPRARALRRLRTSALIAIVALPSGPAALSAQDSDFEAWRRRDERAFSAFLAAEDAAFAEFLEREWIAFEAFRDEGLYREPKLDEAPVADAGAEVKGAPAGRETPPQRPVATSTVVGETASVEFHGIRFDVAVSGTVAALSLDALSPEGFAAYWRAAASDETDRLVDDMRAIAEQNGLNDFMLFRATVAVARLLYPDANDAVAATWFVLSKLGYDVRVAYGADRVALLLPSPNQLYNASYFLEGARRLYLMDADGTPVRGGTQWRTYAGSYPGADRDVALELPPEVGLPDRLSVEELEFTYRNRAYTITVPVNANVISLLADYPHTDWWVHFAPTASRAARSALVSQLGAIVAGRSPAEAANTLLRFVQTAFPYRTDQEHFGYEKWQAPEEIVFYRYSDCDDRSILYAWLLREVMGWDDVVGLLYPGHLAVAVPASRLNIDGDTVTHAGVRYLVTDPTYIGADIGMAMPQFQRVRPEVLSLAEVSAQRTR